MRWTGHHTIRCSSVLILIPAPNLVSLARLRKNKGRDSETTPDHALVPNTATYTTAKRIIDSEYIQGPRL